MKRIGLSQRVDVVAARGERRDALDQRWADLLAEAGYLPVPLASGLRDVAAAVEALGLGGVILTGGNDLAVAPGAADVAPERDCLEARLIEVCTARGLPVLGVCRGMQSLAVHGGAHLVPVEGHIRAAHTVRVEGLLGEVYGETTPVTCYHGLAVEADSLPAEWVAAGWAEDGTLEAMARRQGRQVGIMWHPERGDPFRAGDVALVRRVFGDD